jgi:PAS domain S-box-containing protein
MGGSEKTGEDLGAGSSGTGTDLDRPIAALLARYAQLTSGGSLVDFVESTLGFMRDELGIEHSSIAVRETDGSGFRLFSSALARGEAIDRGDFVAAADTSLTEDVKNRAPLYRHDVGDFPLEFSLNRKIKEAGIRSTFVVPLWAGGVPLGTLNLGSEAPNGFNAEHREVVTLLAPSLAQSLSRALILGSLLESEERFRAFASAITDGIMFYDDKGILDLNEGFSRMLGYSLEECIGRSPLELVVQKDRELVARRIEEQTDELDEVVALRKDGTTMPALISGRSLAYRDSTVRVVSIRDLTEEHRVRGALAESRSRYQKLFETFQDTIYVAGLDGALLDVNAAAVELFGFESKEELMATDLSVLFANPRHRDDFLARLFAEGSIRDVALTLKTLQGRELHVLETANVVRDRNGAAIGYQGIIRDVTVQRKLEQQLVEAQKLEAIGRLAGQIAHDFNNLLTVITGFADLAQSQVGPEDAVAADIHEIQAAATRAGALTQQLQAFGRKQALQPRILDFRMVLRDCEETLRETLGADVELEMNLGSELGLVEVDPEQIEHVLVALARDSREAMPDGGRVEIQTHDERFGSFEEIQGVIMVPRDYAVITMSDTSEGMDEEKRERVFEPFFSTGESEKGMGLRMATVYGIVKQSAGYIFVDSEPGAGTTFTIYLPHAEVGAQGGELDSFPATAKIGIETVLLVDDDAAVRGFTRRRLENCGYTVLEADGTESALERLGRGDEIDLLLTDLVMPGGDGASLAREVMAQYPNVGILLMSGYADCTLENSGLEGGDIAFLQKPFTVSQLRRSVRSVLQVEQRSGG